MSEAYIKKVVDERLGIKSPSFSTYHTKRGQEMEKVAIATYQKATGSLVEHCGFTKHPYIEMFGGSPDGIVAIDGLIEVKCLTDGKKIDEIHQGKIPSKFMLQMAGYMLVTGRQWCDFVLFCPQLKTNRLYIKRMTRSDFNEKHITDKIKDFNNEVEKRLNG
jgi:predicted phage-related endonuclease